MSPLCITRFSSFALVCATSFAARPLVEEVHIATNGHFVKKSAAASQRHTNRERHLTAHNDGQQHQSAADTRLGASPDQHKWEQLKSHWEHAKREFYKDADAYSKGAGSLWLDDAPYWICRMVFVGLVIYNLLTTSLQQLLHGRMALKETKQDGISAAIAVPCTEPSPLIADTADGDTDTDTDPTTSMTPSCFFIGDLSAAADVDEAEMPPPCTDTSSADPAADGIDATALPAPAIEIVAEAAAADEEF